MHGLYKKETKTADTKLPLLKLVERNEMCAFGIVHNISKSVILLLPLHWNQVDFW